MTIFPKRFILEFWQGSVYASFIYAHYMYIDEKDPLIYVVFILTGSYSDKTYIVVPFLSQNPKLCRSSTAE